MGNENKDAFERHTSPEASLLHSYLEERCVTTLKTAV